MMPGVRIVMALLLVFGLRPVDAIGKKRPCAPAFKAFSSASTSLKLIKNQKIKDLEQLLGLIDEKARAFNQPHFIQKKEFDSTLEELNHLISTDLRELLRELNMETLLSERSVFLKEKGEEVVFQGLRIVSFDSYEQRGLRPLARYKERKIFKELEYHPSYLSVLGVNAMFEQLTQTVLFSKSRDFLALFNDKKLTRSLYHELLHALFEKKKREGKRTIYRSIYHARRGDLGKNTAYPQTKTKEEFFNALNDFHYELKDIRSLSSSNGEELERFLRERKSKVWFILSLLEQDLQLSHYSSRRILQILNLPNPLDALGSYKEKQTIVKILLDSYRILFVEDPKIRKLIDQKNLDQSQAIEFLQEVLQEEREFARLVEEAQKQMIQIQKELSHFLGILQNHNDNLPDELFQERVRTLLQESFTLRTLTRAPLILRPE